MRIAMISMHTCPLATLGGKETGGMIVYVRDLTRELGRSGIGVDVFTRSQDDHQPHIKHDLGNGNRVFHIPAGPERPLPKDELFKCLPEFVGGAEASQKGLGEMIPQVFEVKSAIVCSCYKIMNGVSCYISISNSIDHFFSAIDAITSSIHS